MKNKLTYFIARSSMFGIGFFLVFKNASKDAWISLILGTFLGIIVLYIYNLLKTSYTTKTLKETLIKTNIGKIYQIILIIFYLYLMTIILLLLPIFVNSFYLINTPKLLINIPFFILAIYITFKEKSVLENLSSFLCILSIIIILLFAIFLTNYIDITELYPIFSNKVSNILETSLIYAAITSIPQILTINFSNNFKNTLKDYILASTTLFTIVLFTTLALGDSLIKIYSFPEYAVLKQIKILNFIENIENISSFIWYFDMFIALSTITTNLKNALPKKYNLIYFILISLIILIISSFQIGGNYALALKIFYYYPIVLFIFFLIFITLTIYLRFKKNTIK